MGFLFYYYLQREYEFSIKTFKIYSQRFNGNGATGGKLQVAKKYKWVIKRITNEGIVLLLLLSFL